MSEKDNLPALETARETDPREVLGPVERAKILALLTMGCSRRMAAKQVGCAGSTITRTADRDEQFFEQLAEAECRADVRALKLLCQTSQQEKYWRVAAWLLERRNPEEYGRRAPHTFTPEQVEDIFSRGLRNAMKLLPADLAEEVSEAFQDALENVADELNLSKPEQHTSRSVASPAVATSPTHSAPQKATPESAASDRAPVAPERCPVPLPTRNGKAAPATPPTERPAEPVRRSCLEQFVQRGRKPELQPAGS